MAGITLEQATNQLNFWLDASQKISQGQEVRHNDDWLKRADLGKVNESITFWDSKVKELSASASGARRCVSVSPR